MIVKIWPIKGAQGLKKSVHYVQDNNKVTKLDFDDNGLITRRKVISPENELGINTDEYFINNEENIDRVLAYMANEEKIKRKYISGYMCEPQHAQRDFDDTWQTVRGTHPHKAASNLEKEILAFHIVQSFPEELDISDEEVHQCGMELLQRIEKHQGIVCSHVHPVIDEEGEVHGACKHNHILINAYIDPFKVDPNHPERIKYHDCKETYAQLQIWNDEIAIEHGLPIILNPDKDRTYSWIENYETKNGRSWKERVRLDIEDARRMTNNWSDFKKEMESYGYSIREGTYVTYTTPNDHKVRAHKLGRSYTKESLELYWNLRESLEQDVAEAVTDNAAPPLWKLSEQHQELLTMDIPLGTPGEQERPYYSLPLSKSNRDRAVLNTYFNGRDLYNIRDQSGKIIASATGQEIVDYLDKLNQDNDFLWSEQKKDQEETFRKQEEYRKNRQKEDEEGRQEYHRSQFRNSRTHQYYEVRKWNKNGRRRTNLELIFLIAATVIQGEDGLWDSTQIPEGRENEAIFGPTAWKIQNMLDSIHIAQDEGLESAAEVDQKLNEVGAEYSRTKAALNRTQRAKEKMEPLAKALEDYEKTSEVVEQVLSLPNGLEKEAQKKQYAEIITQYNQAKTVMYGYKVKTQAEIDDFKARYTDISKNLPEMQEKLDETKEQYRKLKKLKYNIDLAQNEQYCYGPEYGAKTQQEKEDLWHAITDHVTKNPINRKQ